MKGSSLSKYKIPDRPGVYFFLGRNKKILYIGRATSLKDRIKSYFGGRIEDARGPLISRMIPEIKSLDWRQTDSVLEAILLEADLIRKFRPPHNTDEKDDKSFNCVVITDEEFPRVLVVRKKDLDSGMIDYRIKKTYGPFPEGGKLSLALKIIRKILPFRDTCEPCLPSKDRICKPCFNRQIGLCPGTCTGEITRHEYSKTVRNIRLIFEGKKKSVISALTRDMKRYARLQEFEKASRAKKTIFALRHIKDVSLIATNQKRSERVLRIEGFDVAHTAGTGTVGVMVVVEGGKPDKKSYRTFNIRTSKPGDDIGALTELLTRRLRHSEWGVPDIIVLDGGRAQLSAGLTVIEKAGLKPLLVSVVKNERHRPEGLLGDVALVEPHKSEVLLANQEAHRFAISFHRRGRSKRLLPKKE